MGATGTWFDYDNLPSVVAYRSQLLGNSYTNGNINDADFQYGFRGWILGFVGEQKISNNFTLQFNSNVLRNVEAPDKRNEGGRVSLTGAYDMGQWITSLRAETFFVEHDAVPAFYNDWLRGHNNRQGWGTKISLESKENNFRVNLLYFDARLINSAGTIAGEFQQDDLKTVFLTLETAYASF